MISSGGKRQLILWTAKSVISLDPATGNTYWKEPENIGAAYACSTPMLRGDLLFVGGIMLKLQADHPAATTLWPGGKGSRDRVLSNTSTGLLQDGHVYSARTSGQLICLDRNSAQAWDLFSYRVYQSKVASEIDSVVVGIVCSRTDRGFTLHGDIAGETLGDILFETADKEANGKTALIEATREMAEVLARQSAIVSAAIADGKRRID